MYYLLFVNLWASYAYVFSKLFSLDWKAILSSYTPTLLWMILFLYCTFNAYLVLRTLVFILVPSSLTLFYLFSSWNTEFLYQNKTQWVQWLTSSASIVRARGLASSRQVVQENYWRQSSRRISHESRRLWPKDLKMKPSTALFYLSWTSMTRDDFFPVENERLNCHLSLQICCGQLRNSRCFVEEF